MKITRQHTLWIVILAILAGIVLFMVRAKVAGFELPPASQAGKSPASI